jgi:adenylate cyclase
MTAEPVQRRLAAILAADVVGYSRLMEQDEAGTLAALKERRKAILDPLMAVHRGRIVKVMGDGVLVEFSSAVNAVACAVELQKRMAAANDGLPEERRILLRVGINLGDVLVEGGDLYGDGVNVAARLEGLADPGGICVSAKVHDEVCRKLDVLFDDAGEQTLKNMAEPLRIYRTGGERGRGPATRQAPLPEKPAVAVLPFVNMSGDPDQEYFSDGITEDIITELSRFRSLQVIARNSAFSFKGKAAKVQEIARELAVGYVVEGSVRRAGTRIRVTAQLIEAEGGTHLWAERYERPAEEIFAIQDEVVRTAATLAGRLQAARVEGLRRRPTASLSAYECVLRGNSLPVDDPASGAVRRQLFEKAITLDPDYALAHAQLAMSHAFRWQVEMSGASEDLDRAFELAMRAVSLDPQEIVCHSALAYVQLCHQHPDEAEFHARKALALNPNRPNGLAQLGFILARVGQADDAVALITDAMRLDPHHPTWYWMELGVAHFVARRYAEAVAAMRHRASRAYFWQTYLAASYAQLGEEDAMRSAAAEIMRLRPDFSVAVYTPYELFKLDADREHLASSLRKAGLPE